MTYLYAYLMSRIVCAFSCQADFLKKIDQRAKSLGMNRSQYIVQVLRQEILAGHGHLNVISDPSMEAYLGKASGKRPRKSVV